MAEVAVPIESDDDASVQGSPKMAKRGPGVASASGGAAVTLSDVQRLLELQSASWAKTQAAEIRGAMKELKEATRTELRGIREEVVRHSDYITQLRDQGERLEARVLALETAKQTESTAYPSSSGEGHQKNLLIFGGRNPETHRDDLLPELRDMLERIGVLEEFQDIFTTGPRRGHAMGVVKWAEGVTDQELKKKMIKIVQEIRGSGMASKSMTAGKNLWAAISKTKMERMRSSHAGKTKRLILEVNESEKHAMDVEWGAGSVWVRSVMVASATRPPPRDVIIKPGKLAGSWVDINQIARLLGSSSESLAERWTELIAE